MTPYYDEDGITIYHGDCREVCIGASYEHSFSIMLTDPPYGIDYETGAQRLEGNARSIKGDKDCTLRDWAIKQRGDGAALVFGSPRAKAPKSRAVLVWDQGDALGMGDLSIPWKPSWQLVYVLGGPWAGRRDCGAVIRYPPVQSVGRDHPHEKPVGLLQKLLDKCIPGPVLDPFMGVGSTLVAAKPLGRRAVGIEIEERYCEIAAKRLAQGVLALGDSL